MEQLSVADWLNFISVMQYYDDMLEAAADDASRDNIFLNIALQKFQPEWILFKADKAMLQQSHHPAFLLSVHMPCSVHECLKVIGTVVQDMHWQLCKFGNTCAAIIGLCKLEFKMR